jgi:ubiquitin carboxyl-terminal hydrolase 14
MSDCCTPELIQKLVPARNHLKALDDKQAEAKKQRDIDTKKGIVAEEVAGSSSVTDETHANRRVLYDSLGVDAGLAGDVGANVSGWYDLVAVLTHVGRTAESGHYLGWVKIDKQWFKFDDEKVSPIEPEEITKLEGGGDWHSAYICLYRSKSLKE